MFSRATKLIVRSLGPRQFYIGKQNFKNFFIGGAGEIGRTQSQLLRNSMKLNTLALYDVTTTNKPLPNRSRIRDYCDNQPLTHIRETKELVEETKELVEALYRLPIAEGVPTLNHSLMSNEIISKLRPKAESPGSGFRERGTIGERRERSSPSSRSAIELSENERSIERRESKANRGPLYTITSSRRCDRRQPGESELSYGDRPSNDDYFPQGEEFEDEIGMDNHQSTIRKIPEEKPRRSDDQSYDLASIATLPMFRRVSEDALTRFITHVYSPSVRSTEAGHAIPMSKGAFEKNAAERLQILIDKVSEFKRRIFRPKSNATKSAARSDKKEQEEISNENNSTNEPTSRSGFIGQRILSPTSKQANLNSDRPMSFRNLLIITFAQKFLCGPCAAVLLISSKEGGGLTRGESGQSRESIEEDRRTILRDFMHNN
ncbi:uncharacterized protein LOC116845889 isoform X7 [Odontomachus brunneus]|uniref:uncharacterized protein LOC116845889 isoform X7 n=1 Tax=Odontomachus brunneus TaxID=486640 RepID=UPI0013F2A11B|nr:uncharacterized protein LOC116845889 isoform X7 [Odontomachus brunneus]